MTGMAEIGPAEAAAHRPHDRDRGRLGRLVARGVDWLTSDLAVFMAAMVVILFLALYYDAIAVALRRMDVGSLAEWVTGVTIAILAFLAWRTSRDAARVSGRSLALTRREAASGLSWWLEGPVTTPDPRADPTYRNFAEHGHEAAYGSWPESAELGGEPRHRGPGPGKPRDAPAR